MVRGYIIGIDSEERYVTVLKDEEDVTVKHIPWDDVEKVEGIRLIDVNMVFDDIDGKSVKSILNAFDGNLVIVEEANVVDTFDDMEDELVVCLEVLVKGFSYDGNMVEGDEPKLESISISFPSNESFYDEDYIEDEEGVEW